jgi:hypothetical protein
MEEIMGDYLTSKEVEEILNTKDKGKKKRKLARKLLREAIGKE